MMKSGHVAINQSDDKVAVVMAEKVGPAPTGMEEGLTSSRYTVVAPSNLPAGYPLVVQTSLSYEDTFTVLVPDQGVHAGQTFEATPYRPEPITGRFSDGPFDCNCSEEVCCISYFCTGLTWAAIMEKMKLNFCANKFSDSSNTFQIVAAMWFVFYITYWMVQIGSFLTASPSTTTYSADGYTTDTAPKPAWLQLTHLINLAALIYWLVIQTKTRAAVREKYMIPGGCCGDCCLSFWCNCCATLQIYRHMKQCGDTPARFQKVGKATMVV